MAGTPRRAVAAAAAALTSLAGSGGARAAGVGENAAVLLEPISTVSVAVVGALRLGERSVELVADGRRLAIEPVPAGADPGLRLFRMVDPAPLAPVPPNTVCGAGEPVTYMAVAYPPDAAPGASPRDHGVAFYAGETVPAIGRLREGRAGDGACLWGMWEVAGRP